jgi:hypothetical protein
MNAPFRFDRRTLLKGGALTVGFALARPPTDAFAQAALAAPRGIDPKEVDSFLAVHGDGGSRCIAARSISAKGYGSPCARSSPRSWASASM